MNKNLLTKEEMHVLAEVGFAALDCGDPCRAQIIFSALRFVNPQEPGVYIGWALSLLQQNRYEMALQVLQKEAVQAGAYNEEVELFTAIALKQTGHAAEGLSRLRRLQKEAVVTPVKNVAKLMCDDGVLSTGR